ncbi:tyrosine-protein phosphatase 10D-like [Drosophila persimilis]|uniref:tyrosine-protein phosphatase 10D-like n=1 Tax=Drosophila persimilis TaxID=7234 RepID=UPI000F0989D3|nr:tyrosine-protein phosphatase 10D-like [Drosophila persimilis]
MICKDSKSNLDIIDPKHQQHLHQHQPQPPSCTSIGGGHGNGYNTLQHRRKSQLITFSSSSCDIKNSLSHEHISNGGTGGTGSNRASRANVRLSFAEEDVMIIPQQHPQHTQHTQHPQDDEVFVRRRSLLEVELGVEVGEEGELVPQLELDEEEEEDEDEEEEEELNVDEDHDEEDVELYMHDEFETHIDAKSNNANDDSGGGSYEDSHALHSSLGGSNRNSLEKDDDDIEVDVISTDVSCYDQLLGSSCNTRNGDDDDIATLMGDADSNYATTKLCKTSLHHGILMTRALPSRGCRRPPITQPKQNRTQLNPNQPNHHVAKLSYIIIYLRDEEWNGIDDQRLILILGYTIYNIQYIYIYIYVLHYFTPIYNRSIEWECSNLAKHASIYTFYILYIYTIYMCMY